MRTSATIRPRFTAGLAIPLTLLLLGISAFAIGQDEPDAEFFEKRVRPILIEHCAPCHSTTTTSTAGLVLDSGTGIRKGGSRGPAIVAGHPEQSLLIRAISYEDRDLQMPPKGRLPEAQRNTLADWIKRGAFWPGAHNASPPKAGGSGIDLRARMKHWAWQPLLRPAVPKITGARLQNPIDLYVGAKLKSRRLKPSKRADRGTLIRRVTYDLIGIPPSPAEVEDFVNDRRPNAYEIVVDRLLKSPHFGEKWARHWLDLARYAETDGHEFDFDKPNAYRYRDYVIRAFNSDVPYDQFVLEHVAGDLLPDPRVNLSDGSNESIQATGFWWLGEGKHSPVDLLVDEVERVDNQIDVFSKTFLGMGVACARCHDHKFDAITARDYYALSGYMKSSRFQQAIIDLPEPRDNLAREIEAAHAEVERAVITRVRKLAAVGGDGAGPALVSDTGRRTDTSKFLRELAAIDPQNPLQPFASLVGEAAFAEGQLFQQERTRVIESAKAAAEKYTQFERESVLFEPFSGPKYTGWYVSGEAFKSPPTKDRLRLNGDKLTWFPAGTANSWRGSDRPHGALRSQTFMISKKKILYRMAGRDARINLIVDNFQRIRDPLYGGLTISPRSDERMAWHVQDVSKHIGHRAYIEIIDSGNGFIAVDEIRFADDAPPATVNPRVIEYLTTSGGSQIELARGIPSWLSRLAEIRANPAAAEVLSAFSPVLKSTPPSSAAKVREIEGKLAEPRYAMAMADGTGEEDRVHIRGSTTNLGDRTPRRFLEACSGANQPPAGPNSGRLELARRMLKSPLVPRVIVNRVWHHYFGAGIVKSVDDFGFMGSRPTHPELLDWLASELMEPMFDVGGRGKRGAPRAWSLKHIHRLIVLSETYRQSSAGNSRAGSTDPENKLLHRVPVRRLQAEAIRDGILAVSGRLNRALYGPSVLPNLTPFMEGRGKPRESGPLDGDGRRSIYISVRRNFLTPMLLAFDYPVPFSTMGRRTVSNVPAQALTLLNNAFVTQQAEAWAARILETHSGAEARIRRMYMEAFSRPPDTIEMNQAREYVKADSPAAWADFAHVLFNVKEFIFVR